MSKSKVDPFYLFTLCHLSIQPPFFKDLTFWIGTGDTLKKNAFAGSQFETENSHQSSLVQIGQSAMTTAASLG